MLINKYIYIIWDSQAALKILIAPALFQSFGGNAIIPLWNWLLGQKD